MTWRQGVLAVPVAVPGACCPAACGPDGAGTAGLSWTARLLDRQDTSPPALSCLAGGGADRVSWTCMTVAPACSCWKASDGCVARTRAGAAAGRGERQGAARWSAHCPCKHGPFRAWCLKHDGCSAACRETQCIATGVGHHPGTQHVLVLGVAMQACAAQRASSVQAAPGPPLPHSAAAPPWHPLPQPTYLSRRSSPAP